MSPRVLSFIQLLALFASLIITVESSRARRNVMLSIKPKTPKSCQDNTITEKNTTSNIILTGTVTQCDLTRAGSYKCNLQIWRVMKGSALTNDLLVIKANSMNSFFKKKFLDVYGFGNTLYCDSNVKVQDTRIVFLNRSNNRLILSASVEYITLKLLENVQDVINGKKIIEQPKKIIDPCNEVLCGYGSTCQNINNTATCVCPAVECTGQGEDDLFAPVCGSNGITYPNECRLKAAQCSIQKRIRTASQSACDPVVDTLVCEATRCENAAVCVVDVGTDGSRTPSCVCPTCDHILTAPVCGSDQNTYRTKCDLRRSSCINGRKITVVRASSCDPCDVYDDESQSFIKTCDGICSINPAGLSECCSNIECSDSVGLVCGSDGNTYESECAILSLNCKTTRNVTVIADGNCPAKKEMTLVRGSVSIADQPSCPGDCNPKNKEFKNFVKRFAKDVNDNLMNMKDETTGQMIGEFAVTNVRKGSAILIFRAYASTSSEPITAFDDPGQMSGWVYEQLFDPLIGAVIIAGKADGIKFVVNRDPKDDLIVEDVCLQKQCDYGQVCHITKTNRNFTATCSCDNIGDPNRLSVTHACKLASTGNNEPLMFVNQVASRKTTCKDQQQLNFIDMCQDPPTDLCSSIGGCSTPGTACIVTNGQPSCKCITCNDQYKPVCASDGQTFRSACELHRHNCMFSSTLTIGATEPCASQCDDVKCWHGAQCEVNAQGNTCVCPTVCVETVSKVCASDGNTYDNHCKMVVAGCNAQTDITVVHSGPCDEGDDDEMSGDGGDDSCNCKFGGSCASTVDDEDSGCICPDVVCPPSANQVCGSNGVTYAGVCELNKDKCKLQKMIKVASQGSCKAMCSASRYGCCADNKTMATGVAQSGCPEKCGCNMYGSYEKTCDPSTGQCVCKPGVGGRHCDSCKPGYWNFRAVAQGDIAGCMACRCHEYGSTREDCNQMTGRCSCKKGVTGIKCTNCLSDDSWVTASVCEIAEPLVSDSCYKLNCKNGMKCVMVNSGNYECQCPSLSSCDNYKGNPVCGSDGITYADECQMKVIACRQGFTVQVAANMSCKDLVKMEQALRTTVPPTTLKTPPKITMRTSTPAVTEPVMHSKPDMSTSIEPSVVPEPEPEPSPEPEPEPVVTPSSAPEPKPEPVVTPSSAPEPEPEPMSTPSPAPVTPGKPDLSPIPSAEPGPTTTLDSNSEGSGGCMYSDDEDCEESSGDGSMAEVNEGTTVHTTSTLSGNETPTEAPVLYTGKAKFDEADGVSLSYSDVLKDPDSELFGEYSSHLETEIMRLVNSPELTGKVQSVSITSFVSPGWFAWNTGVIVKYNIQLSPNADGNLVQDTLNSLSDDEHQFELIKSTGIENMLVHDWPYVSAWGDELDQLESKTVKKQDDKNQEIPTFGNASDYMEDVEWSVPQFGGASYAEFPRVDALSAITITISFKTFDPEGLLFYSGQSSADGDFISLAIKNGLVEFRFNTGSGPLILRTRRTVNDGQWHDIFARRSRRDGLFRLDSDSPIQGTSPGGHSGLNLDTNVFIGGLSYTLQDRMQKQSGVEKGLTGCIRHVSINDSPLGLNSSSHQCIESHRLAECSGSPCYPNKCENDANCFITQRNNVYTNKCECKPKFEGDFCEKAATKPDPCATHNCHESSTCVAKNNNDGYVCKCPPGRSGSLCQSEESKASVSGPSFMPAFAQDSYMSFDSLGKSVKSEMSIEVLFYTSQPDGLIFYNSQKSQGREGDFIALNLIEGYVEFMYDLGQGMAKLRSIDQVSLNDWHTVRVSRSMRMGDLSVDGGPTVTGSSPNKHSELNLKQPLYLGGVPDYKKMPAGSDITTGLTGALQKFEVNGIQYPLTMADDKSQYNVRPFNAHVCFHSPCGNGGSCHPNGAEYDCTCAPGYVGRNCEEETFDDKNILQDEPVQSIYFDGKTKAMYKNSVKSRGHSASTNRYEITMRTSKKHGLLLMIGKAVEGGDYLALAISNGKLHLRFDLGSGPAYIISEDRVDTGKWVTITVERELNEAMLQVNNGMPQHVKSNQRTRKLNTDDFLWIGGIDYRPKGVGLYKSFFEPFVGCISTLSIHNEIVDLRHDVINSPELLSCR